MDGGSEFGKVLKIKEESVLFIHGMTVISDLSCKQDWKQNSV